MARPQIQVIFCFDILPSTPSNYSFSYGISEYKGVVLTGPPGSGIFFYFPLNARGLDRISDQITAFCKGLDLKQYFFRKGYKGFLMQGSSLSFWG